MKKILQNKRVIYLALALCLGAPLAGLFPRPLLANPNIRYAKPKLDLVVRETPSGKGRMVATIVLSEPVELLESNSDWSKIKVSSGIVGWVYTRNLSGAPFVPSEIFQPDSASGQVLIDAQNAFKEVNEANEKLKQELSSCTAERSTLEDKYATLTSDPNSVLHTKNSLEEARAQLELLNKKLAEVEGSYKALKVNRVILWFLAGGGAVFLGWLIGCLSGSGKKKRSSLYG